VAAPVSDLLRLPSRRRARRSFSADLLGRADLSWRRPFSCFEKPQTQGFSFDREYSEGCFRIFFLATPSDFLFEAFSSSFFSPSEGGDSLDGLRAVTTLTAVVHLLHGETRAFSRQKFVSLLVHFCPSQEFFPPYLFAAASAFWSQQTFSLVLEGCVSGARDPFAP